MSPYYPPASAGGGYATIQEDGEAQPQQTTINFTGAGVTASDGASKTTVNIPGGAGGDLALNLLAPAVDETITAGYSAYVGGAYEIADQKFLELGAGAVFEIG